jgi:hypothetical protein
LLDQAEIPEIPCAIPAPDDINGTTDFGMTDPVLVDTSG